MSISMSERIPEDTLNEIIRVLCQTVDDVSRVRLLKAPPTDIDCRVFFKPDTYMKELPFGNVKECWVELLFLIQRYDLLLTQNVTREQAWEQVQRETFFKDERKVLLRVFEGIPPSMERAFCDRVSAALGAQHAPSGQSCCLVHALLRFRTWQDIKLLKDFVRDLHLQDAVREIDLYLKEYSSNEDCYPMGTVPCGKCVIITNENVTGEPRREGCQVDKSALKDTFLGFNFEVHCYDDLDFLGTRDVFKRYSKEVDHSRYSAFVCCMMSHGDEGVIYTRDKSKIRIQDIVKKFCGDNCPSLIGKPKIFIIQACQGGSYQQATLQMDGPTDGSSLIEPNQADCVIWMATVEGSGAFRDTVKGSWFIQAIVKELKDYPGVTKAHLKVNKDVHGKVVRVNDTIVSQTPIWKSTLTREIIFRRRAEMLLS